ncbi:MAG: LysE/ArgO family amino acid transporter [Galactobacter sp.]|uniref:LysE/ArgO family amino acid transporter n=1 Tax=Galactobacter sp. TaxID=2676125 RepID=UPI0025BC8E97|nr:LysE family transporter [Galactobacter sp.]
MSLVALTTGFFTVLGLIVAIGAQNAYLLRLGTTSPTRVVTSVVVFCAASDTVLYLVGVAGIGAVASLAPWVLVTFQLLAVGFLVVYGAMALRRATRSEALVVASTSTSPSFWAALGTIAAFTWLNPHVYLDTTVMIGSLAQRFGEDKWVFALGACLGSWIWFFALGFGARLLRPVLAKPWTWRILDGVIALIMFVIATGLVVELLRG